MKYPKEATHSLVKGGVHRHFYNKTLAKVLVGTSWSLSMYSIRELEGMGYELIKLKPITLENK